MRTKEHIEGFYFPSFELKFEKPVSLGFEWNDFPENKDWGMEKKYLEDHNPGHRKNVLEVIYAQVLEAVKQSGASPDVCLAVAAWAVEKSISIKSCVQKVEINPNLNQVCVVFEKGGSRLFTSLDLDQYHIPSLAGYSQEEMRLMQEKNKGNIWETLLSMAAHPKRKDCQLEVGGSRFAPGFLFSERGPLDLVMIARPRKQPNQLPEVLARFPVGKLVLTPPEKEILKKSENGVRKILEARKNREESKLAA
jgi:hypothetical protein